MKNIILGMMGSLIAIYTFLSCMSVYSITTRRNEMENSLSQVMEQCIRQYYGQENGDEEARLAFKESLLARLGSDSQVDIDIKACDMNAGLLSVSVTETFALPGGGNKAVSLEKTVIVESEEEEEDSEKQT